MTATTATCTFAGCDRQARRTADRLRACGHQELPGEVPVCDEHLTVDQLLAPKPSRCRTCGQVNRVHLVMLPRLFDEDDVFDVVDD